MHTGKLLFAQLMEHLPPMVFERCVARYGGHHKVKSFSCMDQFLCMAFAQLTFRESLRDIEACLRSQAEKLYHMGIRSQVSRNTLANANATRDWRIYADFAQRLIGIARKLYADEPFGVDLTNTAYALDSTTIDLSLSLFPWAPFRTTKAAVKMHTLLDLRGNIPSFIHISDGKLHDVNILDQLIPEAGAFYVMDRGYIDFARLYRFHQAGSFFVTRAKKNMDAQRRYSHPVDRTTGVIFDQTLVLQGYQSAKDYPESLRGIRYKDPETGKRLLFITNNTALPALKICALYKARWQVELFFRWIKQHLRIKSFFGTSENAVKSQIWIAVSVYVLVAIVKKRLALSRSLYEILQILSLNLFEKTSLDAAL
ncbi:MAG: IS4 family transposase, partial [Steroidobacteraceae bacterium]